MSPAPLASTSATAAASHASAIAVNTTAGGPATSKLPTRSVLALEVSLRERLSTSPASPHDARVRACLDTLTHIQNYAPTLAPMLKTVTAELEHAIYSDQLTMDPTLSAEMDRVTSLDRIPWFTLVSRLGDMRREELSETRDVLADLQHKLKVRERDVSLLQKRVIAAKQEIQARDERVAELETQVAEMHAQLARKNAEMDDIHRSYKEKLDQAAHERDSVEVQLTQANNTIERLSVFKTTKDAADDQMSARIWITEKRELVVPDPLRVTELSIREVETLQKQLYDILNCHLDDLEASLLQLRKKREILGASGREEDKLELDQIMSEFSAAMAQLDAEQRLLGEHKRGLQAAVAKYREAAECVEWTKFAHETQRKYAIALLFSSDGGVTFKPHKCVPYCARCGERVMVCPHMPAPGVTEVGGNATAAVKAAAALGWSWTVPLPPNTTHVQFRRPNLLISIPAKIVINDSFAINEDEHDDFVEMKLHRASRYFKVIWHYTFNKRGVKRPILPRVYTLDKLSRLMSDVYEARWTYESESLVNTSSFLDFFFDFMFQRFQVPLVAHRVIFEVLAALEHHQETNANIHLFVRHLAGSDSVVWKYFRLVAFYIALLDPLDVIKYRRLLHTLYPARSDALYEQLELEQQGYSSSSAKQLTCESVREQIKSMLRRRMEPNLRGFHRVLAKYDVQGNLTLGKQAFVDALGEALPHTDRELAGQQYEIAEKDFGGADKVSVERCAQIAAYCYVYQCNAAGWGLGMQGQGQAQSGGGDGAGSLPMSRLGTQSAFGSVADSLGSVSALPNINANSRPSNVRAGGRPRGMPMVWHLQDELGVNAKLEPDEVDNSDVRRIEKVLLAFTSGGHEAAGVISKVQEMIQKGSAAAAASAAASAAAESKSQQLASRTLAGFAEGSEDGSGSEADNDDNDDASETEQPSAIRKSGTVDAGGMVAV
ncbi:hypothetical protein BCR44DRAFT_1509653 [Catenaria anguillulae PL171]|uniref:Uncharacterized protein n=1 Tax=Catenaria anguillulae PL171 TaxID=765915 RepID=A0A1Y2I0L8_9FUNG|nr:hypothetical protein BCR44DRAFT_1509653 [Catenaria anguillulae PL171]